MKIIRYKNAVVCKLENRRIHIYAVSDNQYLIIFKNLFNLNDIKTEKNTETRKFKTFKRFNKVLMINHLVLSREGFRALSIAFNKSYNLPNIFNKDGK